MAVLAALISSVAVSLVIAAAMFLCASRSKSPRHKRHQREQQYDQSQQVLEHQVSSRIHTQLMEAGLHG
jgi:hypothetical protein